MPHHFIVTRIGIGIHNENWYRGALGLFEAITFPSLCAQTCPDFTCLLIVDRNIPESAKSRLDAIVNGHRNFHIVPIDLTVMQQVHQGCFDYIWERCQDYLLAHRMIVDPFEYIITSVLDADDAWHVETVDLVQKRMTEEMPAFLASERRNMTWTRHTGGACLAFANGLRWYAHPDVVVPLHRLFGDMFVFVAARFSSGISACSSRHTQWASYCNVVDFKDIKCQRATPMWVYVRHDRSEVGWDVKDNESDSDSVSHLHADFGIDFDKVQCWRADHELRAIGRGDNIPRSHDGMAGTEQLDCYFRITALNRQIAILERDAGNADADGSLDRLLASQRRARDELVRRFHDQAQSHFR
jgi:Putative rhamnosyl transferase